MTDRKRAPIGKIIPPLENGDHLKWPEFARRYHAMRSHVKAELINGVVFMASPVSQRYHSSPHFNLITWLGTYRKRTKGVEGGGNGTLRLDDENSPQPDAFLFVRPEHGGHVQLDEDGYVIGAPEWAGEVSASTASLDMYEKKQTYKQFGVREYLVWRVYDQRIDWFILRGDDYELLPLSADGIYRSEVLPGLWLDPQMLIEDNIGRLDEVADQGIASPEHAVFVARLQAASAGK